MDKNLVLTPEKAILLGLNPEAANVEGIPEGGHTTASLAALPLREQERWAEAIDALLIADAQAEEANSPRNRALRAQAERQAATKPSSDRQALLDDFSRHMNAGEFTPAEAETRARELGLIGGDPS